MTKKRKSKVQALCTAFSRLTIVQKRRAQEGRCAAHTPRAAHMYAVTHHDMLAFLCAVSRLVTLCLILLVWVFLFLFLFLSFADTCITCDMFGVCVCVDRLRHQRVARFRNTILSTILHCQTTLRGATLGTRADIRRPRPQDDSTSSGHAKEKWRTQQTTVSAQSYMCIRRRIPMPSPAAPNC